MERATVQRLAAPTIGGAKAIRTESSGSVTEAEEESNHSSFDTTTTASMATTPGTTGSAVLAGPPLLPSSTSKGAEALDGTGAAAGQPREGVGSGATETQELLPTASGEATAAADGAAAPGLQGQQGGSGTGKGAGDQARSGRRSLPVLLEPPDEGTPAAEALAANAAIPQRGRAVRSVSSMGKPPKSLRRLARGLKKKKKKRRNFQGNVIKGEHEQYTLTIGMMLGIRVAVGRPQQMDDLTLMDFMQVDKYLFPPKGCNKPPHRTPPHHLSHDFKFKDYAPKIFHRIRQLFGIDSASYMLSVSGNYNYLEFMSNSKSGQFFFYSHDGRFMIKTQTPEENKFLRKILPHYYQYVSLNPDTLLTRFYGMHRVKMRHLKRKVHFVIMHSVFDTKEKISRIYDLKGSTVGRSSGPDRGRQEGVVYKDLDLVEDGVSFQLGTKRRLFMEQLEKDASFLASLNIMDYSLLIGIHDRSRRNRDREDSLELAPTGTNGGISSIGGGGSKVEEAAALHPQALRQQVSGHGGGGSLQADVASPGVASPFQQARPRGDSLASVSESGVGVDGGGSSSDHHRLHHHIAHHPHHPHHSFHHPHPHHHHPHHHHHNRGEPAPVRSMREFSYESSSGVGGENVSTSAEYYDEENYHSYDDSDFDSEMSDSDEDIPLPPAMPSGFSHPNHSGGGDTPLGLPTELSILTSATNERRLTHRRDHGVQSRLADGSKGHEIYFVGIIDILQQYNAFKRAETFFKSFKYDSRQISAVEPAWYARRFVDFCGQHVS